MQTINIKWTTSKGRETFGYKVATLRDDCGVVRARVKGGGYDLQDAALAEWATKTYQPRLLALYRMNQRQNLAQPYALHLAAHNSDSFRDNAKVYIDGGAGMAIAILDRCGIQVSKVYETSKLDVYSVTEKPAPLEVITA